MLRSIVVLIACSTSCLVLAHTHCHYDERAVDTDGVLSFCPMDYATAGTCCDAEEEALIEATFNEAGDLTDECADYYQQAICAVCGSFSGHLYDILAAELGTEDGLTMKIDFCEALTTACDGQIDFPDYDGVGYCTMHTGGHEEDLYWSYPFVDTVFNGNFTEFFPDLPDSDLPDTTLAMHQSPDGTMYWLVDREGKLLRVDADSTSTSTVVLDISGGIFHSSQEEGLLNFAFSPMFDTNGYFYVHWTVNEDFIHNRLSKFQYFEGDLDATRNSEEVLLVTGARARFFHSGGWLGFKPSDYGTPADYHDLYWALGDRGPQQDTFDHGQRTDNLYGSMVRISVPSDGTGYLVPDGNYPDAELPEICAVGFRNLWKCSFDRLTDELYCGDVGHNDVETIKKVECGNNYGWVRFEGSRCTEYSEDTYGSCVDTDRSDFTFPIFEYCHADYDSTPSSEEDYTNGIDICGDRTVIGSAVIGGYVYRGQVYADLLLGAYIFGDFTSRNIYYIRPEEDGTWTAGTIISDASVGVYSFAEDNDGELFVIDETNTIYYLPCGDLCPPPVDDAPTPVIPDDDFTTTYEYVGCYGDQKDRVLSGRFLSGYDGMTNEFCSAFCTGSSYFGTQFSTECFCGEATDDPTILGSANCGHGCSGDSSEICGGKWALSVYEYKMLF